MKYFLDKVGDVMITNFGVPLTYTDFSVNFDNLGLTYNNIINTLLVYIIKTQEKNVESMAMETIKSYVKSLLC